MSPDHVPSPPLPIAVLSVHVPACIMYQNTGIGSARFCIREHCSSSVKQVPVTTNVLVRDLDLILPEAADKNRSVHFRWVPVGLRHDAGMCLALRWFAAHRSQEAQGTWVPRAGGQRKSSAPRCFGDFCRPACQVQGSRATFLSAEKVRKRGGCGGGLSSHVQLQRRLSRVSLDLRCVHGADGHTLPAMELAPLVSE